MEMSKKTFLVSLVLLAAACLAFAGGQQGKGEQVVLKVWDQFMEEGAQVGAATAIEQMGKNFEAKYPGVKVERTPMAVEEMTNTLKPALASGKGPDIFYSEVGIGFVGPILKAGYVMHLTDIWQQRGWNDKLYSMARDIPSVAGVVYGIGHELEFVPVYYNKDIFRKVGLPLGQPKNIADFEYGAAKLKAAGYIPLGWGGKDWWYQSNFTTSMLFAFVDKQKVMDGMYRDGTWKLPEVREAIETAFVKWAKNDWYIPNPTAIGWNEVNMVFAQQKSATHITGSWDIDFYQKNIKDFEIGAFQFPLPRAGKPFQTVSFCGSGYLVNAKTKNPKVAIDYLDYVMATEETAKMWVEVANKIPPYRKEIAGVKVNPQLQETLAALAGSDTTPGLSMTVPPEVMSFLQKSAAMVLTGQLTSDQWVEEFQKLWDKSKAEGLTLGTFKL
jgi:raffinose/stachyose/melibiose transport system substrate-binding protein